MRAASARPQLTHDQVRDRLTLLINEIAGIPPERVTNQAAVDGDLRMESVVFVELQVAIEDEYGIELDLIHLVELNEFGAIVDYVYQTAVSAA